ncbi:MAG: hypothetical protein ACLRMG_00625 [Clostridium sp.]
MRKIVTKVNIMNVGSVHLQLVTFHSKSKRTKRNDDLLDRSVNVNYIDET